ncbi:MAG: 3-phosphoshikimate 1-carboxyvinyltransferase [Methylococcaceae bacterium]|nr:3-phosphoshikimate 1-carboxyvinyltransferase [Methylococcaceae bacterium]MCI0734420.1 3-phosphoshikimate 1-carboxyvinyltransferase [Methylococcaceae bacterium]
MLRGECRVAGDKSISHRAVMLGSIATGMTRIRGFLEAEDAISTLNAFRAMGVDIRRPDQGEVEIQGRGTRGLNAPESPLDLGNSGTSMRLLCGLLAGQEFDSLLIGDPSLSRRPMQRVTRPLALMGGRIDTSGQGTAPLYIHGGRHLTGIEYELPEASAQVKSCLLLAGLYAEGMTSITEPAVTRDHTERMLRGFSYPVRRQGNRVSLTGGDSLIGTEIEVPADISSAAFFMVGASIAPGSEVLLRHVGINPTRTGIIEILNQMGADMELENVREAGGEPVADIRVKSANLKGIRIPQELVPLAIDEFPVLLVAASCAEGETVLTGARELRVKESDRIQGMLDGLLELGIDAIASDDGMVIRGGRLCGGEVDSRGDHRIAMAFSIAALRANEDILIRDCANVNTSFPGFVEMARTLGLKISSEESRQ